MIVNYIYMRYAVEVANSGSINKAAEILHTAQPNLSRAIKELEMDLGMEIFKRSAKGMTLTPEGEEFISYAKRIIEQMNDVEKIFKDRAEHTLRFSLCAPRASYISTAFVKFTRRIGDVKAEIFYKETNSSQTLKNISSQDYNLGIIRYAANYDKYYKEFLSEKRLRCELVSEFTYVLAMSQNSPLLKCPEIRMEHLKNYFEIAHSDLYVPSIPSDVVMHDELSSEIKRRIFVFERGSQLEALAENPDTFMWVSPISDDTLDRYGLVQRRCGENTKLYKDMLIYRSDYHLTKLDRAFVTELCDSKRKYIDGFGY